jgi:leucyl aminopeptidase
VIATPGVESILDGMIPTSSNLSVEVASELPRDAEAVVVFVAKEDEKGSSIPAEIGESISSLRKAGLVSGKANEVVVHLLEGKSNKKLIVIGLGETKKISPETLRTAGATVVRAAAKHGVAKVGAFVGTHAGSIGFEEGLDAVVTGAKLVSFDWTEYRGTGTKKSDKPSLAKITFVVDRSELNEGKKIAQRAAIIADGQNFARTIASRPGNEINPPALAEVAKKMAKEVGLACRVLDEKEMKKLGMGGILAVGAGANRTPPRMIVFEHKGKAKTKAPPLLVVGKAITFDTGGISIKPADKMGRMVFDKCGAMAVMGLMYAAAKLKLPTHIVGILASAENHISETAYRPGDLLRMYNGVTVEVTNTDAEGRLVLGDALSWGIETYKPAAVVDLATLTGGCVVALGHIWAGLMSNSDALSEEITKYATQAGEKVWRLPIGDEVREMIKGDFADIVNSAGRWASPLTGGAFLSYFIPDDGKTPWVHLDIAGVADTEKEMPYYGKGATGWGVRTLVNWVTARR